MNAETVVASFLCAIVLFYLFVSVIYSLTAFIHRTATDYMEEDEVDCQSVYHHRKYDYRGKGHWIKYRYMHTPG